MGGDKRKSGSKDKRIGQNLRLLRLSAGLSQTDVAERLGVTYQQVQKYERGTNRLSAVTLYELGVLYNAPYADFFAGLGKEAARNPVYDDQTLKIAAALSGIADPALKRKIRKIIEILAA